MRDYSSVFNAHPAYIDEMYQRYSLDPFSVDEGWQAFFRGFDFGNTSLNGNGSAATGVSQKELGVMAIIGGFRDRGHLLSTTNPIRQRKDRKPHLDLADYGLEEADLNKPFSSGKEIGLEESATLRQILDRLHAIYAGNIGFEFNHILDRERRSWLRAQIETRDPADYGFSMEKKRRILEKLNGAVGFERFLHTKYVGQKRFSLEGGETTIPALDAIIQKAADGRVEEVVIGMAHRGRLNVLANIMGKTYEQIFSEFEGTAVPDLSFGDGDVKYHLGYSSQVPYPNGKTMQLKLAPNPSHLEAVNPVVMGFARAKADILYNSEYDAILPILIHGDAAVAGQGIVYETAQMSQLRGYRVGGTIHFVINNQIGFTTDFDDARTSTYSTSAANMIQAPVFHVNGDDPEAVIWAVELATEYRQRFNADVFIDMVCYRRHGHNEGDDPQFTQPEMYRIIKDHPNPRELYVQQLLSHGKLDASLATEMEQAYWDFLQSRLDEAKEKPLPYTYQEPEEAWRALRKQTHPEDYLVSPETGVETDRIRQILNHLNTIPDGFKPLSKVSRLIKNMNKAIEENKLDWSLCELTAYGSLLLEGFDVRLSGQDAKRGTFSHRHAVLYDDVNYQEYNRLASVGDHQGRFFIFNSLLSEFGVLGFEYGYSQATPHTLVIWEAQFGDFSNGAQSIIDQFIYAGESKWQRMSGLVMLLPHGYEGQGPEHSSARLERYLQGCAENNVTVANITSPANFFHAMRRQLHRPFRKPMVIMSPKSLLRHPLCVSGIEELEPGTHFQETLDDPAFAGKKAQKVRRVIFCSGKVYYDLLQEKLDRKHNDVAICRIEQLYPYPMKQVEKLLLKYTGAEAVWVQEEPLNMGAWGFLLLQTGCASFRPIGRKPAASPATGHYKIHDKQQRELIDQAFHK
ncbi:MAG: 2-oxoglutarate dehydrogenase E1 component [Saprospiraceae bacterium]|nr:2-oxoglutarate dehydrogenase E1 component [Saprospiraceae bacterium]